VLPYLDIIWKKAFSYKNICGNTVFPCLHHCDASIYHSHWNHPATQ